MDGLEREMITSCFCWMIKILLIRGSDVLFAFCCLLWIDTCKLLFFLLADSKTSDHILSSCFACLNISIDIKMITLITVLLIMSYKELHFCRTIDFETETE